jgi:hypothetical protein
MCDISTLSKYVNRPSPPRPANEPGCRGKIFTGNDGNLWTSVASSSGVYRWVKAGKGRKSPAKKSTSRKSPAKKTPANSGIKTFTVIYKVNIFKSPELQKSLSLSHPSYLKAIKASVKSNVEANTLRGENLKVTSIAVNGKQIKVRVKDLNGNFNPMRFVGGYIDTDGLTQGVHWLFDATAIRVSK